MAANNQKPPRHKNSNYVVFRKSLFEPKKKLKSDLFNYSCVHLVFILFKNNMISVALTLFLYNEINRGFLNGITTRGTLFRTTLEKYMW